MVLDQSYLTHLCLPPQLSNNLLSSDAGVMMAYILISLPRKSDVPFQYNVLRCGLYAYNPVGLLIGRDTLILLYFKVCGQLLKGSSF